MLDEDGVVAVMGMAVVVDKDGSLWCGVGFHLLQLHNAVSLFLDRCCLPSASIRHKTTNIITLDVKNNIKC